MRSFLIAALFAAMFVTSANAATLDQSLTWNDVGAGAHYDVKVRNQGNGVQVKLYEAGTATSVVLATLLDGLDFGVEDTFMISVRSKVLVSAGPPAVYTLESAYTSEITVPIQGFPIPDTPTVVINLAPPSPDSPRIAGISPLVGTIAALAVGLGCPAAFYYRTHRRRGKRVPARVNLD